MVATSTVKSQGTSLRNLILPCHKDLVFALLFFLLGYNFHLFQQLHPTAYSLYFTRISILSYVKPLIYWLEVIARYEQLCWRWWRSAKFNGPSNKIHPTPSPPSSLASLSIKGTSSPFQGLLQFQDDWTVQRVGARVPSIARYLVWKRFASSGNQLTIA